MLRSRLKNSEFQNFYILTAVCHKILTSFTSGKATFEISNPGCAAALNFLKSAFGSTRVYSRFKFQFTHLISNTNTKIPFLAITPKRRGKLRLKSYFEVRRLNLGY